MNDTAITFVDESVTISVLANDMIQSPVTVSIQTSSKHGDAYIPFSDLNAIGYSPNSGYEGKDTIIYKIAYTASPTLFATGKIFITVSKTLGIREKTANNRLLVFPNPVQGGILNVLCTVSSADNGTLQLHDVSGKLIFTRPVRLFKGENTLRCNLPASYKGSYILRLSTTNNTWNQKVLFE
jgi:hypothetical protein